MPDRTVRLDQLEAQQLVCEWTSEKSHVDGLFGEPALEELSRLC